MQYSAFTSIFKVFVEASNKDSLQEIGHLLSMVLADSSILQSSPTSFASLLASFKESTSEQRQKQLAFFDNCVCRLAKKPVHYQDLIESMSKNAAGSVSPLFAAISEQWPFVVKNGDAAVESAVGTWIARALGKFKQAGENTKALKSVRDSCLGATENKNAKSAFKKSLKDAGEAEDEEMKDQPKSAQNGSQLAQGESKTDLEDVFGPLPVEGTTHNALQKWEKDDLEVSVEQGRIAELMLCLCSQHEEVRRQAYTNISRFMMKLKVRWCLFPEKLFPD